MMNQILFENEGAVFKGNGRGNPTHVWSFDDSEWQPYTGNVPKPYEWGYEITEAEFEELKFGFSLNAFR